MAPFGNRFGLPVWIDRDLTENENIVFNAGTHTQAIRVRHAEFAHLARPNVAILAADDDWSGR